MPTIPLDDDGELKEFANNVIYAVSYRARLLVDMKMEDLRDILGTDDTPHGRRQELIGMTKGQMIEAILTQEFADELI